MDRAMALYNRGEVGDHDFVQQGEVGDRDFVQQGGGR